MPWGPREANPSPIQAEGDKQFFFAQYNDRSGSLAAYMPVYKDVSDAGEFNQVNPNTKITVGTTLAQVLAGGTTAPQPGQGANQAQSINRVVLGSNYNSGAVSAGDVPVFYGIYSPTNPADRPSTGDVIRVVRTGPTPVAISSGQNPAVADYIIADFNQNLALTRPKGAATTGQPSVGLSYIGRVLATAGVISNGTAITPTAVTIGAGGAFTGSASNYFLVNGFIDR